MREYLEISATPFDEQCAQVGSADYQKWAKLECNTLMAQIRRVLGPEPEGSKLAILTSPHDFGTYYEVAIQYDDVDAKATGYAMDCESGAMGMEWDAESKRTLKVARYPYLDDWIEETKRQFPTMFQDTFDFGCGEGWKGIIQDLCAGLIALEPTLTVHQIKEKFGTLRFYIGSCPNETCDQVWKMIEEAERKSGQTCEQCGKLGKQRSGGWIRTLCDECELRRK